MRPCCGAILISNLGFNEVQTDKRNAYKTKLANKAMGQASAEGTDMGDDIHLDRDGQPLAKKARLERSGGSGAAASGMRESYDQGDHTADEEGENEGHGDDDEEEAEDEEDGDGDERLEADEPLEESEQREADDEALDNGEDSD